jgi:hypothetical protein
MEQIERVKVILKKALENFIELEEFYKMCEDRWEEDPLLNVVLDNIEALLEHVPVNLASNTVSDKAYKAMKEYRIMKYDLDMLERVRPNNTDFLLARRATDIRNV